MAATHNLIDKARQLWRTIGVQTDENSITPQMVDSAGQATLDALAVATPYVGGNGNWFIQGEDTGVAALGKDGKGIKSIHTEDNGDVIITYTDQTTQKAGNIRIRVVDGGTF